MTDVTFADPQNFAGQLQRGRGIAAQRAPSLAGAADLIYQCVVVDIRWDRQVEQRGAYLTRMIHRLNLSTAPLERHLSMASEEEDVWLTLDVLASLGFVGRSDAIDALRRYAVTGVHWTAAIDALGSTGAWKLPGVIDGLADQIAATRSDTELYQAISGPWEPWTSFGHRQPRIAAILDELAQQDRTRRQDPETTITVATVDVMDRVYTGGPRERRAALDELGKQGDLRLLVLAADVTLRNSAGWTPGMARALAHLGERATTAARSWIDGGDPVLAELGTGVLANHGDWGDAPHLMDAVAQLAQAGAWCALESAARGLGRIGYCDAAQLLRHIWDITEHSLSRHAILEGLAGCDPAIAAQCASEGLDDCETDTQRAACDIAPDTAAVRQRLAELRDDPLVPHVAEQAAHRLSSSP